MQPLNEAYKNEILEAYQKISDTFDDFTQLMRRRVPYESWPKHCQIAGVNPDLLGPSIGCDAPGTKFDGHIGLKPLEQLPIPESFREAMDNHCDDCLEELEEALENGWLRVQPNCRPDESFRAMIGVISKWKKCLKSVPEDLVDKIQDMGRVEEKLLNVLEDEIFETTSKHNPYWHSENEEIGDKLDDLRRKFSCLHDNLWDIIAILRKDREI